MEFMQPYLRNENLNQPGVGGLIFLIFESVLVIPFDYSHARFSMHVNQTNMIHIAS